MGSLVMLSLFSLFESTSSLGCVDLFYGAASEAVKIHKSERGDLFELSQAACLTKSPESIWLIAYHESRFRFNIIRDNRSGAVYYGQDAERIKKVMLGDEQLKSRPKKYNYDMGVMQINWRYHSHKFNRDPKKIMKPAAQLKYISTEFAPEMFEKCKSDWMGCYHSPKNGHHAEKYRRHIDNSWPVLKKSLEAFVRKSL